ncbi:MAG: ribonuclease P protein component [Gemmataceae bacterium]|nr:ribonuclease P protein component [Gemmataceae bacterium]
MKKPNTLRQGKDFRKVLDQRRKLQGRSVVFFVARNDLGFPRLGLVPGRKFGNAVRRNLWKRLCREAFRMALNDMNSSMDLVVFSKNQGFPQVQSLVLEFLEIERKARKILAESKGNGNEVD